MKLKEIETEELIKIKQISKKKHFSHMLDPLYIKFNELYHETSFINKSVFLNNDNPIYIPNTINKKTKKYSFYNKPIEIFSENEISKIDYLEIKNYFDKIKSEKLFKFEIKHEQNLIDSRLDQVEQIFNEIYIDLSQSIEQIKNNFSSNTRNEIKKNYDGAKFEIINKENYKENEIFQMMNFHIKISGKQTRSEQSWKQNEKMILSDRGFLIKVTYKDKLVSLSFFYHNNFICRYYSSVADRDYFKQIRNMHHKSIWLAIDHVKEKCKFFFIGPLTIFNKKNISDKEKNIENFKSKFKGINSRFLVLNSFPEYDFYKKFIISTS